MNKSARDDCFVDSVNKIGLLLFRATTSAFNIYFYTK